MDTSRNSVDYVYIGFSAPRKFKIGAAAIKLWQRSNFSHTYVRFESKSMPSVVFHASKGMVHFREFDLFQMENEIIYEFKIPVKSRKRCIVDCISRAGDEYGYSELAKIIAYDIAHTFGFELDMANSEGYICSELVGNILYNHAGLTFNKPYFLLTPNDIFLKVSQLTFDTIKDS